MQKEKLNQRNKGITLVALIITLIIMLLLVTVTITVSLKGGLFNTAKGAAEKTLLEKEKEQLISITGESDLEYGTIRNKTKLGSIPKFV